MVPFARFRRWFWMRRGVAPAWVASVTLTPVGPPVPDPVYRTRQRYEVLADIRHHPWATEEDIRAAQAAIPGIVRRLTGSRATRTVTPVVYEDLTE